MSVTTDTRAAVPVDARIRFRFVLRSEHIKLTSLRSTTWALGALAVAGLGTSVALAATMESGGVPSAPSAPFALWTVGFGTYMFGQLVVAVLGVLAMSSEYTAGTIQTALVSAPGRLSVLAAKASVLFSLVTVTALLTSVLSWAVTYPLFDALGIAIGLDAPGFLLGMIGGACYLGLTAVFALGVAATVRSAAGGIAVVLGVLLLLPLAVSIVGGASELISAASPYFLSAAGESMGQIPETGSPLASGAPLGPVRGGIAVIAWTGLSVGIGAIMLRGRDV